MAELLDLFARGGGAKLAFGLVIEGVLESWVSDESRSYIGRYPWSIGGHHVAYAGLDASNIQTDEQADFLTGELKAGGLSLTINDTRAGIATQVFGSRRPSRRTFLASSLTSSATTVTVVSTSGWATSGVLHLGRECIRYTGTTATTFTGCTRGFASSLAVAHDLEDASGIAIYDIEVTDTPGALGERRAQLYVFIDDVASGSADVIWRGVVKGVQCSQGLTGYVIDLAHASVLLDQEFGSKLQPFGLRGFYFSDDDPFELIVREEENAYFGNEAKYVFHVTLTGFYETIEQLRDAVTTALHDSSYWSTVGTGAASLPQNDDYSCVVFGGHLAIQFRTNATPRWAEIEFCHTLVFGEIVDSGLGGVMRAVGEPDATGRIIAVTASTTYVTYPRRPSSAPTAYTRVAPSSTRSGGLEAPTYPPNRVYYQGDFAATSITSFESSDPATALLVTAHDSTNKYFSVERPPTRRDRPASGEGGGLLVTATSGVTYWSTPDRVIEFLPVLSLDTQRWDELLTDLIGLTVTSGASGTTPWLPSAEFDTADITRQTVAAGGAEFVKTWEIRRPTKLRDLLGPELQILGLCWTCSYGSTLTVRKIEVTTASTTAAAELSDRADDLYDRRQAADIGVVENRDGIINTALVKFGYDARSDKYADVRISAKVRNSHQLYGEHSITIEPIGEEVPAVDIVQAASRDSIRAVAIVATHSTPYVHVTLGLIPGLHLAAVILGDIVSITDGRVPFLGVRGVTARRGQVVGKTLRWTGDGAPSVDLVVRMAEHNAGAYAPCARLYHDTPLGVSNTRVRFRAENWDSDAPATGTRYDYANFRVGDYITFHQEDVATAATQSVQITAIDTTSHYLYVTPAITLSMDAAGTVWVAKFSAYDTAVNEPSGAPKQHDYAFIADSSHRLGTANDAAKVQAA